jgi:hypothetical protein
MAAAVLKLCLPAGEGAVRRQQLYWVVSESDTQDIMTRQKKASRLNFIASMQLC